MAAREQKEMDIAQILVTAGIGTGVGIVTSVLSHWYHAGISEAQFHERLESVKKELTAGTARADEDFRETFNELRAVVVTVAKLQSSQDVVNVMTGKTLEILSQRCAELEHRWNERDANSSLMTELLDQMKQTKGKATPPSCPLQECPMTPKG